MCTHYDVINSFTYILSTLPLFNDTYDIRISLLQKKNTQCMSRFLPEEFKFYKNVGQNKKKFEVS